jgi:hypothetical protein
VSPPPPITIKLEIHIPTGGAAPAVVLAAPCRYDLRRFERSTERCPGTGAQIPLRPSTGTICAWTRFGDPFPTEVFALVMNAGAFGALGPEDPPPLGSGSGGMAARPGVLDPNDPTRFLWNGSAGGFEVPGAVVGNNMFVVWSRQGSGPWSHEGHPFTAQVGTNDPCGAPAGSGTPCFPYGSGSHNAVAPARQNVQVYPAVWLIAGGGFAAPALAVFNATWALQQVPGAPRLTWDNAGDGSLAPHARLKLCPTDGWVLELRFGAAVVTYAVPFKGDPFGPLVFPERHETVPGLGAVALPRIVVSPV